VKCIPSQGGPVEINACAWYGEFTRQDELIDDRPALADLGETDQDYISDATAPVGGETGETGQGMANRPRRVVA